MQTKRLSETLLEKNLADKKTESSTKFNVGVQWIRQTSKSYHDLRLWLYSISPENTHHKGKLLCTACLRCTNVVKQETSHTEILPPMVSVHCIGLLTIFLGVETLEFSSNESDFFPLGIMLSAVA